jgi:predicted nucleic acid-binding Zn ribbon protein
MGPYKKKNDPANKRNADVSPLKEAIEAMLKTFHIDKKFYETQLIDNWEKIMGKPIAQRTTRLFINKGTLYVTLNSSALKQELAMSKTKMIKLLNESVPQAVIEDILFF